MSPTVAGNLKTKQIRKGGEGRVEQELAGKCGGGGSKSFSRGISRGYGYMTWREVGGDVGSREEE